MDKHKEIADKDKKLKERFTFWGSQVYFDKKYLKFPAGSDLDPSKILKALVDSFGEFVPYKTLDETSGDTASDFLRGKILTIKHILKKHRVPCEIHFKRWVGYVISDSRPHS